MAAQSYETGSSDWSDGAQRERAQAERSAEHLQEQLSSFADSARPQAADAVQPLKDKAREIAEQEKDGLADRLSGLAGVMDSAAEDFAKESPMTGEMLRAAAGSMRNASGSLRQRHIDDITRAMDDFARNRPVMLFAGALAAGFAASRFLKSSTPERSDPAKR